jgi:hypothetical protein
VIDVSSALHIFFFFASTEVDTFQRDNLSSLVDTISAIPGYAAVRSWFMQAVPALSKYISLPPSREVNLRFKLTEPINQLSLSYLKKAKDYYTSGDPVYYLGHHFEGSVRPVKNGFVQMGNGFEQHNTHGKPMFNPQR